MLHLVIVYAVWGSTFLAIRVAAQAFPPFTLSAMRVLGGAALLFAIAAASKQKLRYDKATLKTLALSGVTLWAGGHAALLYGAQRADAGYAAVVFGTTPIWSLLFEAIRTRRTPPAKLIIFTLLGFAGIIVLTLPSILQNAADATTGLDPLTVLALLAAPIGWALGSTFQTKEVSAYVSAAYQQLFGGLACAALAFITGEKTTTAGTEAYLAYAYLIVPGLIPAFTSYVRALQLLPESRVMTFAYVNPMIAVVLGAWLLDEQITPLTIAGMAILLAGVAGIQTAQGSTTASARST